MITERCWAVVPAAGRGSRMASATPKQYLPLHGRTVLEHSLLSLLRLPAVQAVVVALPDADDIAQGLPVMADERVVAVTGGAERSDSVLAGLDGLATLGAASDDWVLVHDAARPCLDRGALQRLLQQTASLDTGGAILAEPVADTVKQADARGQVVATVDRSALWRAQTPQAFRFGELQDALREASANGWEVTDEASAMERCGHPVWLVAGERSNLKVTQPADLKLAAFYLDSADQRAEN
ncbi:MAG: 2-C-methyl-D-erythritol 4-phosphate cytidylyltransferase [Halieaceae bacterium]